MPHAIVLGSQQSMIKTVGQTAQKFEDSGRSLWAWMGPVLVKLWISFAFFFR